MYCTLSSDNRNFVIIFEKKQDARMFLELTSTTDWLIPQQSKEYFEWYLKFTDELLGLL